MWLFLGAPGCGKSTAADTFVDGLLAATPGAVAVIHDPHGENSAGRGYRGQPFPSVAAYRAARAVPRRAVFRTAEVAELAQLAVELGQRGQVVLVVDELDLAIRPGGAFVDDGAAGGSTASNRRGNLYRIANYGRHLQVALVGTARRASRVGTDVPANAEGLFLLRLSGHTDLAWARQVTDEGTAQRIAALPRYRGILWNRFGATTAFAVEPGRITFAR